LLADTDGDGNLQDETAIPIETVTGSNAMLNAATLGFDAAGRRVVGYQRSDGSTSTPKVAHDHNGDGDFGDANEVVSAGSSMAAGAIPSELAIDAAGNVAYVRGTNGGVVAAWDRNGDGDFSDTVGGNPELVTTSPVIGATCVGATFDSANRLAIIYTSPTAYVTLLRDTNGDGDFADAGEFTVLLTSGGTYCDIDSRAGQPLTVAYSSGSSIVVAMDKNDDGDFDDVGEAYSAPSTQSAGLRLRLNGTTSAFVGYAGFVALAPTN